MTLALVFLIALGVTSLGVAAYTFVVDRRRQTLVNRALGVTDAEVAPRALLVLPEERAAASVLKQIPVVSKRPGSREALYAGHNGRWAGSVRCGAPGDTRLLPTAVGLPRAGTSAALTRRVWAKLSSPGFFPLLCWSDWPSSQD